MDQDAAASGANFSLVDEDPEESTVDGGFEVGVGEKDVWRLAAEFEGHALHRVGRLFNDDLAHSSAAGEGNLVDVGMLHQRSTTALAESGDDVDDPRRQTDIGQPVRHFERGDGRLLRGFQDAGTSGSQRRRKLPGSHHQRIVPGNDLSGDADGLLEGKADGVVGHRIHRSLNLGGQAAVILEAGGGIGDVEFGLDDGFAGVAGFEFGKHGSILPNLIGQTEKHAAALLGGSSCPGAVFERGLGGGNGAIDVIGIAVGNLGNDLFRGGVVNRKRLVRLAVDPLAVHVHLISPDISFDPTGHRNLLFKSQR